MSEFDGGEDELHPTHTAEETSLDAVSSPTSNFDQDLIGISVKLFAFTYTILCAAGKQSASL